MWALTSSPTSGSQRRTSRKALGCKSLFRGDVDEKRDAHVASSSHEEKAWIWNPEEGSPDYYYDANEPVRFRVEAEVWHDHTPQKPNVESEDVSVSNGTSESVTGSGLSSRAVPYTIIVSCCSYKVGKTND